MPLTPQQFLDLVDANGGPEKLSMLIFNNSYTKVYGDGEFFNPDTDFDVTTGIFTFQERDIKKRRFHSIKFLEYLEGLTFAHKDEDRDSINYRNYRP